MLGDALEICNEIIFDFNPGLSHMSIIIVMSLCGYLLCKDGSTTHYLAEPHSHSTSSSILLRIVQVL